LFNIQAKTCRSLAKINTSHTINRQEAIPESRMNRSGGSHGHPGKHLTLGAAILSTTVTNIGCHTHPSIVFGENSWFLIISV
jgi:hypothetical protein